MKSVVLFVLILIIGALGGIAAGELKNLFSDDIIINPVNDDSNLVAASIAEQNVRFNEKILEIKTEFKNEYDTKLNEMAKKLEDAGTAKKAAPSEIVSDNENINRLQRKIIENEKEINLLRGLIKANQQKVGKKVDEQIEKKEEEKRAKQKAQMAEMNKKFRDDMKKRQEESFTKHTEKMRNELNLSDSQVLGVQEAFSTLKEKLNGIGTKMGDISNFGESLTKREEAKKEWEESVKQLLTPEQNEEFINKKLNKVNQGGFIQMTFTNPSEK
ncbi:MAG: hypothetical protein K8S87_08150 [Planctomycetes bacterium]|nr:hypothetical protein [Planctomycetota bacterium]